MAKKTQRWPIWKIVLMMVGFLVGAIALFVASYFVNSLTPPGGDATTPASTAALNKTVSNMLKLFAAACLGMTGVCIGWLVYRQHQNVPAWKKRAQLPPHRRK
jgi:uncharacterized membrane protein